ncbi:MAG: acetate--CoA ligase family protein [Synergistetes bacterium]|nr:acetate--CoA ligase family protein [Synergistota bacterium]MDW8191660.1 ATP-grasp domain-containing protein [Synergistota bacterium]
MKLLEYQGKEFLSSLGIIDVPKGMVVQSPEEAQNAVKEIGKKAVLKVQIPTGGRGKAGGIRLVSDPEEAKKVASELLGRDIRGFKVNRLLVEEALEIEREMYIGVTIDPQKGKRVFMFCDSGGMDIEEIVRLYPQKLLRIDKYPSEPFREYEVRSYLRERGFSGELLVKLSKLAYTMFEAFVKSDLLILEINPLCLLRDGRLVAADAKVEVDDNALFRQKRFLEFETSSFEDEMEREAKEVGVSYVGLDGDIGLISSGAGLGMCTVDLMADEGLRPANFLETGGGITAKLLRDSIRLLLKRGNIKAILINLYGGVNSLIEAANGIKEAKESFAKDIPIVVKAIGNQEKEAWEILRSAGVHLVYTFHTERLVDLLKEVLTKRGE